MTDFERTHGHDLVANVNMYVVLKIRYIFYSKVICMAQWLSWLERRPVTAEVVSSSLIWVVTYRMVCAIIEYVGS